MELWIVEGSGHAIYKGEVTSTENSDYRKHILAFLDGVVPSGKSDVRKENP